MPPVRKQTARPNPVAVATNEHVLSRIRPIGFNYDQGIKVMLYGKSGTGKTTLWSTFPGPILSVIASGGNKSGELLSIDTPEMREKVSQVELRASAEMWDIINYAAANQDWFRTIVLDNCTGFQDVVLREKLGWDYLPAQKSFGMADQRIYGAVTGECKEIIRGLLGLNINVVIIAHERSFKDEGVDSELIAPTVGAAMTPSLAGWVNGAVDYICQTFIRQKMEVRTQTIGTGKNATVTELKVPVPGKVEYCLRTGPHAAYTTKFRMPRDLAEATPEVIVDPSYDKLMALIRRYDENGEVQGGGDGGQLVHAGRLLRGGRAGGP